MTAPGAVRATAPGDVSPAVVRGMVSLARRKGYGQVGAVALRGRPTWHGPELLEVDGETARVVPAVSALAVQEALLSRGDETWLVVITDRSAEDLGPQICSQLAGARVLMPDLWEVVRERFQARGIEPTLAREDRAVAEALVAATPPEGWPPARGGVLTRDTAFEALVQRVLELPEEQIDPVGLLAWTLEPASLPRLARLADPVWAVVLGWLADRLGAAGSATVDVIRAGHGADAVALALIAGLLVDTSDDALSSGTAGEVRGLLGPRYGGRTPTGRRATAWAELARSLVEARSPSDPAVAQQLQRAQHILAEVRALEELAIRSTVLPEGFTQRLRRFARTLSAALAAPPDHLQEAETAFAEVVRHTQAEIQAPRKDHARSALRLVRWLATPETQVPTTIVEAIALQMRDDAWVDRARADVWDGDDDPRVSESYRHLYERVTARRAGHDERFGRLLASHTHADPSPGTLVTIESLIPELVLPLAQRDPVLLLVVDGMSSGVAVELAEDIRTGWRELLPDGHRYRVGALAALPTVTEICRTSLFNGTLLRGGSAQEEAGLDELCSGRQLRSALFHKSDLDSAEAGATLPERVRRTVEDRAVAVVAAVLNTVDDTLSRADPAGITWRVETIRHLGPLLNAARAVGRVVVLASDHGHVVERRDSEYRAHSDALNARARPAGEPEEGEVRVEGRRVVPGIPLVLPWRETIRYQPVRAGYHGGASPAEAVVPVVVLGTTIPHGWDLAAPQEPAWWLGAPEVGAHDLDASREAGPEQTAMFEPTPEPTSELTASVLATRLFAQQLTRAGRSAPDREDVARILDALLRAHGRMAQERLASVVGIPLARLAGTLSAVQRVLNVDGYEALRYEDGRTTVVIDTHVLREQFDLQDRE